MRSLLISVQRNLNIIGLKQLHQSLLDHGHDSHLLYLVRFNPDDPVSMERLGAFVRGLDPQLVGVSLTSAEHAAATALTEKLRGWIPEAVILWGGIHPTVESEACAAIADYICVGEGDVAMLEVAKAIDEGGDVRAINNIGWMDEGRFVVNPLNPLVADLDQLAPVFRIPAASHIQSYGEVEPLAVSHIQRHSLFRGTLYRTITSRGCPFHCTYCCNDYFQRLYPDWRLRHLSAERVIKELEAAVAVEPRIEYVSFMDDCFFSSPWDRFSEICKQYKDRIGIPFMMKAAPHRVNDEYMRAAVDAGLAFLHVGLQSGSERVCREVYKRGASPKVFRRAAGIVHRYPVAPWYDIIMDNPFETLDERLETVQTLTDLPRPYYLQAFSLTFYAGTQLRERALAECPERVQDPTRKDMLDVSRDPVNHLKALAPVFPRSALRRLVGVFGRNPESHVTKVMIFMARMIAWTSLQPLNYFRLLVMSQRGSVWRTLKILPYWFDLRAITVFNLFHRTNDSTEE